MAQTTILSAGVDAAVSSDVTVEAGATVTIGAFVNSGYITPGTQLNVLIKTPGVDVTVGKLTSTMPAFLLNGPGVFHVVRHEIDNGEPVGVFVET